MSVLKKKNHLFESFFHLRENNTSVKRELLAGFTTFATLAYTIVLIPKILSETGMDFDAVMIATIITGAFSSLLMGLYANYPMVSAPGIALSAYFSYSVVLLHGDSWQTALGVVFITGVIFLFLNLLRIRQLIIEVIPLSLRMATTAGLGLFLALIGLKNAEVIVYNPATFLGFGDPSSITCIMMAVGIIAIGTMMVLKVPGAIFLGIIFVWVLGLIFGFVKFAGFISLPSSILPTLFQLDVRSVFDVKHIGIVISFLFVALFDSAGTLVGLAEEGGYLKKRDLKTKKTIFPRVSQALMPDTTGSILASFLGTSTVAVYIESAAGMEVGGRTGLTAIVSSLLFLLALFFTPFASSIPHFATAPALIIIGGLMLKKMKLINWKDPSEWIPSFATLILIPLTYSVANGIAVGYITYAFLKLLSLKAKEVHWFSWLLAALFILKFIFFPKF